MRLVVYVKEQAGVAQFGRASAFQGLTPQTGQKRHFRPSAILLFYAHTTVHYT